MGRRSSGTPHYNRASWFEAGKGYLLKSPSLPWPPGPHIAGYKYKNQNKQKTDRGWCRLQWFVGLNKIGYFESWFEGGKLQLGVWAAKGARMLIIIILHLGMQS